MEPVCSVNTFKQLMSLIVLIAFFGAIIGMVVFFITRRQNAGTILETAAWSSQYLTPGIYRFQIINRSLGLVALQKTSGDTLRVWKFTAGLPSAFDGSDQDEGLITYDPGVDSIHYSDRWANTPKLVGA